MLRVYFTENCEKMSLDPSLKFDYSYRASWFTPAVREMIMEMEHVDIDTIDPKTLSTGTKALVHYMRLSNYMTDIKWLESHHRSYLQKLARDEDKTYSIICHQNDFVVEGQFQVDTGGTIYDTQTMWDSAYAEACWGNYDKSTIDNLRVSNNAHTFTIPLNERVIVCHMDDEYDTLFLDMMRLATEHASSATGIRIESPYKSIRILEEDSDWKSILKQDVPSGLLIASNVCTYIHHNSQFHEMFNKSTWTLLYFTWNEHSLNTNYYKVTGEDGGITYKADRLWLPIAGDPICLRSDFEPTAYNSIDGVCIYEQPFLVEKQQWSEQHKGILGLVVADNDFLNPHLKDYMKLIAVASTVDANDALLDLKWNGYFKFPVTEVMGRGKR